MGTGHWSITYIIDKVIQNIQVKSRSSSPSWPLSPSSILHISWAAGNFSGWRSADLALEHHPWWNKRLPDDWRLDRRLASESHLLALYVLGLVSLQTFYSTQFTGPGLSLATEVIWTLVKYPEGHGRGEGDPGQTAV